MGYVKPQALYKALTADVKSHLPTLSDSELSSAKDLNFWPGISVKEAACVSLLKSLLKKYIATSEEADKAAIDDFIQCNDEMSRSETNYKERLHTLSSLEHICLGELKGMFHSCLDPIGHRDGIYSLSTICSNIDVGSGSSVGASGGTLYHKLFSSQMTCTNVSLMRLFSAYTSLNSTLGEALTECTSTFGPAKIVRGSSLSCTAKNTEISRAICTEPILNMLFQKGIEHVLCKRLIDVFGIDITIQPRIQAHLAMVGSLSNKIATLDLSSASNRIPYWIFRNEEYVPPVMAELIDLTRSPMTRIPGKGYVQLHMVSSMGNATTFPLMTLFLCCCIAAAYKALGIKLIRPRVVKHTYYDPRIETYGNFGVFGDDMALDAKAYRLVVTMLELHGLVVNHSKSFCDGDFRESCGFDYISGHEIRGVYCKSLKTQQDRLSLLNNLLMWSHNHEVHLNHTVKLLMGSVSILPVPSYENDCSGIKVPSCVLGDIGRLEFNEYGSFAYKRWVPISISVPADHIGRYFRESESNTHLKLVRNGLRKPSGVVVKHLTKLASNPAGLLICVSEGSLLGGGLSLRNDNPLYRKTLSVGPCWDFIDKSTSRFSERGWSNWVTGWATEELLAGLTNR